jgi:hypothetical protein
MGEPWEIAFMLTASLRFGMLALLSACSGVNPAREKVSSIEAQDACFTDRKLACAPMIVCTTHIQVMNQTWECDELDLDRNGRVDCLDDAEVFACNALVLPRVAGPPPLNK